MLLYRCPRGHLYGKAGWGEDLTRQIERAGRMHDCPECLAEFGPDGPPFPGAEARIEAALALHTPLEPYGDEPYQRCCTCALPHPCHTRKALTRRYRAKRRATVKALRGER